MDRITKAVGRTFSKSCNKPCRYTDEEMLKKPEVFVLTTAAVLKQKAAKLETHCAGTFGSLKVALRPTCRIRLQKIASLIAFTMKALNKASADARNDNLVACKSVVSQSVGKDISESISKIVNQIAKDEHKQNPMHVLNEWGEDLSSGSFCEKQRDNKDTSCENPNSDIAKEFCDAEEQVKAKRSDELSTADAENIINNEGGADKVVSNRIDEAKENLEEVLQEDSPDTSDSLIQMGDQMSTKRAGGFGSAVGGALVWLIVCGIFGTIFAAIFTALCWVSAPFKIFQVGLLGVALAIPACPIVWFCVFWGGGTACLGQE